MRKLAALLLLFFIPSVTAAGLTTSFHPGNQTVQPGQATTVGVLQVTANQTNATNLEAGINYPFATTLTNQNVSHLRSGNSYNITITAKPGEDTEPRTLTRPLTVTSDQHSVSHDIQVTIPKVSDWRTTKNTLSADIPVGSSGQFGNLTLYQNGNVHEEIHAEITGNLSDYVYTSKKVDIYPDLNDTLVLKYRVARDVEFGDYTGQLKLTDPDSGKTTTVNLSATFSDDIDPVIKNVEVQDMMATTTQDFLVEAADNQGVKAITGLIYRKENGSYKRFKPITFTHQANTEKWNYSFSETGERGQYKVILDVHDEAGNIVNTSANFTISRLNITHVLNANFKFDSMWLGDQSSETILKNDMEAAASAKLTRFKYTGNSTVDVGLLKPGDETPTWFNISKPSDTIPVTQKGEYQLVVNSYDDSDFEGEKKYDGVLQISTVRQHVNLSEIQFSGMLKSDQHPKPEEFNREGFSGYIGYKIPADYIEKYGEESDKVVLIAVTDKDDCMGSTEWNECSSVTLGEVQRLKNNITRLKADKADKDRTITAYKIGIGGLFVLVLVVIAVSVLIHMREGTMPMKIHVPK